MASQPDVPSLILKERQILIALCQGDAKALGIAGGLLSAYKWCEPVHQIIFSCLISFPATAHIDLRERLVECATRKGFPDIEWEDLFKSQPPSTQEVEELILQIRT